MLIIIIALFTFWDAFFDRWILYSETLREKMYWGARRQARFGSFFLNPNHLGAFCVLIFPSVLIRVFQDKTGWKRIYCLIGILALLFAFVKTQSRGATLGMAACIIFFILIPTKSYSFRKKIFSLLILTIIFFTIMPGFMKVTTDRFSTIEEESSEEGRTRQTIWKFTIKLIQDKPLLGIGLGEVNFQREMIKTGYKDEYSLRPLHNPHNSYLQIAVMVGVPALILFILCNMMLLIKGIILIRKISKDKLSLYLTGLIAGLIGYLVTLVPDMQMFTPVVAPIYWLIFGMVFSICNLESTLIET